MTALEPNIGRDKPKLLRAIFILNALKIFLAFGLFIGFQYYGLVVGSFSGSEAATLILFTMFGYIATFVAIVASILKRNVNAMRAVIVVDFLISIPAKAFVGFAIAIIGMALSFSGPVKAYFDYRD